MHVHPLPLKPRLEKHRRATVITIICLHPCTQHLIIKINKMIKFQNKSDPFCQLAILNFPVTSFSFAVFVTKCSWNTRIDGCFSWLKVIQCMTTNQETYPTLVSCVHKRLHTPTLHFSIFCIRTIELCRRQETRGIHLRIKMLFT